MLTMKHFSLCPWTNLAITQYIVSLRITMATVGQTFLTLVFLLILSGFKITRNNLEKWHLKQVIFFSLIQYTLDSFYMLMWSTLGLNTKYLTQVLRGFYFFSMIILTIWNGFQNQKDIVFRINAVQEMRNFRETRNLFLIQTRMRKRQQMGFHASIILSFYYIYELVFHLLIEETLIPGSERNAYAYSEILMFLHEICDFIVMTLLVLLVSQHTFRNNN